MDRVSEKSQFEVVVGHFEPNRDALNRTLCAAALYADKLTLVTSFSNINLSSDVIATLQGHKDTLLIQCDSPVEGDGIVLLGSSKNEKDTPLINLDLNYMQYEEYREMMKSVGGIVYENRHKASHGPFSRQLIPLGSDQDTPEPSRELDATVIGETGDKFLETENNLVVRRTLELLGSPNTYPLLYGVVGNVPEKTNLGKRAILDTSRSRQAILSNGVIQRLPSFDHVDVADIRDIREELKPYLTPFRAHVVRLANELSSPGLSQSEYADIVQDIFVRDIQPAIAEIATVCENNKSLKSLLLSVNTPGLLMSTLSFTGGLFAHFPLEASAGLALAVQVASKIQERQKLINNSKKNPLYFLYGLDKGIRK